MYFGQRTIRLLIVGTPQKGTQTFGQPSLGRDGGIGNRDGGALGRSRITPVTDGSYSLNVSKGVM